MALRLCGLQGVDVRAFSTDGAVFFGSRLWRQVVCSLYREVLRVHQQQLPQEMRSLGDAYVREEFRLHKTASQEQAIQFVRSWRELSCAGMITLSLGAHTHTHS